MSDWVEVYLSVAQFLLLLSIPVLLGLTAFSWYEAWRLRPLRLPLVIALTNTIIGAAATWLAWVEFYRELAPPPEWYTVATATAVVVLCYVPMLSTAYLAVLEARRRRE